MLKRYFFSLFATALFAGASLYAKPVTLTVGIYDPTGTMPDNSKNPPCIPNVDLNGNVITFDVGHDDYTLCIIR